MEDKSLSKTSWGKKLLKLTGTKIQALFYSRVDQSRDISALLPVHQGLSKQGRLAWLGQPF